MTLQTVTGPIAFSEIGRTLIHEHIFVVWAGAEFDPTATYDREEVIAEAVKRLRRLREEFGVKTFVDPCPIELGRDVRLLAEVSERSEVNIVCTTGFYHQEMGLPSYWRMRSSEEIAELYVREIEHGVGKTGIRAGAIKVATGAPTIAPAEAKCAVAAAIASQATGVSIITHTQNGVCGPEQQELFHEAGVGLHRCLIGHCCGSPDHAYHRRVVDGGSYIGFDRVGMTRHQSDEKRADNLVKLFRAGYGRQIAISQDRFCYWTGKLLPSMEIERNEKLAEGKEAWPPDFTYLFTDFIPMLRQRGMTDAEIYSLVDDNPRRFFEGTPIVQGKPHLMGAAHA